VKGAKLLKRFVAHEELCTQLKLAVNERATI
jgi:hypothetical protein